MSKNYYYKMNKYKRKYLMLKDKLGGDEKFHDTRENNDELFGNDL